MKSVLEFFKKKQAQEKITVLTCYDFWSAQILNSTSVDALLVGDSLAMVVYGHNNTLPATIDQMAAHVEAVARGCKEKFIIADMPFLSFRKGLVFCMEAAQRLLVAGAQAIKIEGIWGNEEIIRHLIQSGIPVMAHIGLTPQFIHQLGGFKVQGKTDLAAENLVAQAQKAQELGCFSLVVECVPKKVGQVLSKAVQIPVIGIGAGVDVDGQVLVLHDLLALTNQTPYKFVRQYAQGASFIKEAVENFCRDVKLHKFPTDEESFL